MDGNMYERDHLQREILNNAMSTLPPGKQLVIILAVLISVTIFHYLS